ncbi:hypothetical protein MTR67_031744 [Solanum verrucosum]|uniref:Integrase catalytic domain-containing protein n=1 Tax=Solanum verrucosum TaxID=315347 RepID=A0AAF0ZI26_SOLVR|nr:hypothetical protein MTR67_031744 [Solanum verrucosum]
MPILEWKWERIAMDFVVGLPKTLENFDSIWVVVDGLTKSTHFIPTNRQSERTIQVLEDMLKVCVIDFGGHWDKFIPLCDFSYNNSYHSSIDMAPFEVLYGRGNRSPIRWFEVGDVKPLGVDLVKDAQDNVRSIQDKLLAAQSRQKKYADHKVRDMAFHIGENILLKVSPMKWVMRFGKNGNLSPQHIGPFERHHGEGDYIIKWDSIVLDKDLQYEEEPIAILDRDVSKLRTKDIKSVNVQWKHRPIGRLLGKPRGTCETSIPRCLSIQVLLHSFLSLFFLGLSLRDE